MINTDLSSCIVFDRFNLVLLLLEFFDLAVVLQAKHRSMQEHNYQNEEV